jgi:hypothetical protein
MVQKLKQHLERVLRHSETQWEKVVGMDCLAWDREYFLMELCDELRPQSIQWTKLNELIIEMIHLENEMLNLYDETIDFVCFCIRKYSKKYGSREQQLNNSGAPTEKNENIYHRDFFKRIVASPGFQNSLQEKICYNEKGRQQHTSLLNHKKLTNPDDIRIINSDDNRSLAQSILNTLQDLENRTVKADDSDDNGTNDGLLQLNKRRAIVKSSVSVVSEIVSYVDSSLLKARKSNLEDIFDKLQHTYQKHKQVINQIISYSSCTNQYEKSKSHCDEATISTKKSLFDNSKFQEDQDYQLSYFLY